MTNQKSLSVQKDFQIVDVFPSGRDVAQDRQYPDPQKNVSVADYCTPGTPGRNPKLASVRSADR